MDHVKKKLGGMRSSELLHEIVISQDEDAVDSE